MKGNISKVKGIPPYIPSEAKMREMLEGCESATAAANAAAEAVESEALAKKNVNNNFSAAQTVNGTFTVNGDIVQNGEAYETHAEQLYTKKDLIKTREGAVGGLGAGELTGIEAEKYDGENNGALGFDADGTARVGDSGDEQPLLTRDEAANLADGQVLVWDGAALRAVGSSAFMKKPTYSAALPETLSANTEYYLGESAALSFAFPAAGELGQYCFVKFVSGDTAATLTVTSTNHVGELPVPIASKTYEVIATWNGSAWVCSYRGY